MTLLSITACQSLLHQSCTHPSPFTNTVSETVELACPTKLFMTTSGGLFHMLAGCRGRCSVAITSRISEYSWMRIVSVGPCTAKTADLLSQDHPVARQIRTLRMCRTKQQLHKPEVISSAEHLIRSASNLLPSPPQESSRIGFCSRPMAMSCRHDWYFAPLQVSFYVFLPCNDMAQNVSAIAMQGCCHRNFTRGVFAMRR